MWTVFDRLKRKEEKEVAPITQPSWTCKLWSPDTIWKYSGAGKFYSLCDRSCLKCIALLTFCQNPPHHTCRKFRMHQQSYNRDPKQVSWKCSLPCGWQQACHYMTENNYKGVLRLWQQGRVCRYCRTQKTTNQFFVPCAAQHHSVSNQFKISPPTSSWWETSYVSSPTRT